MENNNETVKQLLNDRHERAAKIEERIFKVPNSPEKENESEKKYTQEIENLKKEITALKSENFNVKTLAALEKSGCLKPELVIKAVPKDCENLQDWIDTFKTENDILFKQPPRNHGGNFKPSNCCNLSPTELMNNYIRGI